MLHRYNMENGYAYPRIEKEDFSKSYNHYLILTGQKQYAPPSESGVAYESKASSIESILDQDAHALLDKVVSAAFSIVYRLKIYRDISSQLDYNWFKTKNELLELESSFYRGQNMNVERRKSMLSKELLQLDRQKLEQKVECWKDLSQPINYFVDFWHQTQELKQDRKFLE